MQTFELLTQTKQYNNWANRQILNFLQSSAQPHATAARILGHLLLAEIIWLRRMSENNLDDTNFNSWTSESVADCAQLFEQSREIYERFFADLTETKLETVCAYKNSQGISFENVWREALTHVFNHSAYHRGQVALQIRALGDTPPNTDFIHFRRTF